MKKLIKPIVYLLLVCVLSKMSVSRLDRIVRRVESRRASYVAKRQYVTGYVRGIEFESPEHEVSLIVSLAFYRFHINKR